MLRRNSSKTTQKFLKQSKIHLFKLILSWFVIWVAWFVIFFQISSFFPLSCPYLSSLIFLFLCHMWRSVVLSLQNLIDQKVYRLSGINEKNYQKISVFCQFFDAMFLGRAFGVFANLKKFLEAPLMKQN